MASKCCEPSRLIPNCFYSKVHEACEEGEPGEEVLPAVRQALHRRQGLHVQRDHREGIQQP